jgi:glycosyltransferase involved in cell wall biosynthesis
MTAHNPTRRSASGLLVSILTPSFNQAGFIGDCLTSVAAQTYANIEHVVCDGGSTDHTIDVLRSAIGVKWISEPDRGQSHALNKALAMSRGQIIGWLNSDDAYADRRSVERAVEVFRCDPEVGAVFGDALLINEVNEIIQVFAAMPYRERVFRLANYIIQPTMFFRRDVLDTAFVREELNFVMDRDLILRLGRRVRFARIAGFVAVDRHQTARKVLGAGYVDEAQRFDAELGVATGSATALLRKSITVGLRFRGVRGALRLPSLLDQAFELRVPRMRDRLRNQLFLPRHRMRFR